MALIRWLHLSDFHVGKDDYAQRKLFSQIVRLVGERVREGFALDFVFLTGDLANKGRQVEYEEFFEDFFVPLVICLGGDDWGGKIYSIPGNHDVERGRAPFFNPVDVLRNPEKAFDPTPQGKKQREQFASRFENYSSNEATNSPTSWIASNEGSFSQIIPVRGQTVGVVAVNTAWLSKNDQDRHLLTPGINILEDALNEIVEATIKIVLGHHPMNWLHDDAARMAQNLLGKHRCIYLHGHLHENNARFEDGGSGLFLAIQSGAAFQGRSEDQPRWVNGLVWAELDTESNVLRLQPNNWSATHREWKVSTDAFPNHFRSDGEDWWKFHLPGSPGVSPRPQETQPGSPAEPASESVHVRGGWAVVNREFIAARSDDRDISDQLLHFFDGRPPNWRLAVSTRIPRRSIVDRLFERLNVIEDASRPMMVNLIGAGGEGKSTVFLQVVSRLVCDSDWICLWRSQDQQAMDFETISQLSGRFSRVIVAIDEAHSAAEWLSVLLLRMKRLSKCNVHFLLCSRSIDWRAEAARYMHLITRDSDYQEVSLRGLSVDDAGLIVEAWSSFGKEGLRNLYGLDKQTAVATLHSSALSQGIEDDEGAFLGAMLYSRYGDTLKDKIRSILYRLRDIEAPGGTLLEAYAMIAVMHNEGLRFLSLQVLAEALDCSFGDARRRIVNPLADEAIAAGGGRFVLCRHREIAKATVDVLKETNLFGEVEETFAKLSKAAIVVRQKGEFVPELHKWDYTLPDHFVAREQYAIAIACAEAMQAADPSDIRLRVNLSKIYREAREPRKAAHLFRDFDGAMETRVSWHEWAVAERDCDNTLVSIVLAACSVCDLPGALPARRDSLVHSFRTMAMGFQSLYERYHDTVYLQAMLIMMQISAKLSVGNEEELRSIASWEEYALERGGQKTSDTDLVSSLASIVSGLSSTLVNVDALLKGRIPRSALGKYDYLKAMLK
jgi:hypothetical protein